MSIESGITWLVSQQNTTSGYWGDGNYRIAQTAFAVLKLESYAIELGFSSPFDAAYVYHEQVEKGLNYIFSRAHTISINVQTHGNPDSNGNGIGVYFGENYYQNNYNAGIVLMALVASYSPNRIVGVTGGAVDGRTYVSIAQDIIDHIAWGQTDTGLGRGGWYYGEVNNGDQPASDNSVSGWVVTGLAFASDSKYGFNVTIPNFVKTELRDYWINNIQDPISGGSRYLAIGAGDPVPVDVLKTGNLLLQMAFVGYTTANPKVQSAINYMTQHWNDANIDPGWKGGGKPASYQSAFTMTKGLEALGIEILGAINWYTDMLTLLLAEQNTNGSWSQSDHDPEGNGILSTEWALLAIERVAPAPPQPPARGLICSI